MLLLSLSRLNTYTSHLKIMTFSKEILTRNMIIFGIEITTINSHFKNVYSHQVHWCVLSVFKWFSSIQLLSCVRLFATPWTAAHQASLSITNSQSLPKSIESVMPSNHLILCCPLLLHLQSFPASGSFPLSQFFTSGGQRIEVSASTSVLPVNTQYWSSLGWTGWISLQSKGLSRVFSNTTVQKHQFFSTQLSLQSNSQIHTWPLEKP